MSALRLSLVLLVLSAALLFGQILHLSLQSRPQLLSSSAQVTDTATSGGSAIRLSKASFTQPQLLKACRTALQSHGLCSAEVVLPQRRAEEPTQHAQKIETRPETPAPSSRVPEPQTRPPRLL